MDGLVVNRFFMVDFIDTVVVASKCDQFSSTATFFRPSIDKSIRGLVRMVAK